MTDIETLSYETELSWDWEALLDIESDERIHLTIEIDIHSTVDYYEMEGRDISVDGLVLDDTRLYIDTKLLNQSDIYTLNKKLVDGILNKIVTFYENEATNDYGGR